MKDEGWRGGIFLAIAVGMVLFIAACGPGRSATQTAIAQTEVQQTAEEATRKAPTNTPTPTATPTPTDTPVPTPTEMKETTRDAEGDCEVITGIQGEDGCPVDIESFEMLPCENPGFYTFRVTFYRITQSLTTNICFLIDGDGNKETGFENEGFFGIDWDYCWIPETGEVLVDTYDEQGNYLDTILAANPYHYVSVNPEEDIIVDPFWMTFPPAGFRDIEVAPNAEVVAQGLFYDAAGTLVFDGTQPVLLSSCPAGE
jgi:hypothetical protein